MKLIEANQLNYEFKAEEGDAGVIIKKDGSFRLFQTHKDLDPAKMTPIQIEQGNALLAFAAMLRLPELMNMALDVAKNPTIFDQGIEFPTRQ